MLSDKNWVPVTREELGWDKPAEPESPKEEKPPEGGWEDQFEIVSRDSEGNVIKNLDVYRKPPVTLGEFTGKMFGAGVDQVQGLGMGVVGLAGDLAGVESVKKLGLEGFNDNMREAAMAREEAGMVDFTDIEGVGDAAKWAYGTLLEQAPQLIPTIALGGAGGLAGKQFAKGVVQSAVQKAIANGLTEKAAAVTVANAVASRGGMKYAAKRLMEGGLTREAAEGALGQVATARIAPIAGAAAGNLATGVGMETGSIYGETEDAGLALKYGIPAGAIEGFTDTLIGSPFIRRAFGVNVAKNTAEGSLLKEVGKGVAKGVALEGPAEELPQTYLEQMARAEDDPNFDINSEEAKRERINAVAAGSFIGGAIGGAGGVVESLAPVTANALKGLTQKPLEDPEVPDAGAAAPSGDIIYDKDSVTLDGGVVMRRWNIEETGDNGWVVENAQQDVFDKLSNARGGIVQDGKLFVFPNTQEGASLFDRAETAAAKARGEIVDEDGDGIDDREQGKTDDSDLTALDLSGNESVIQAAKQKETKKKVVEAGIPADAVDELIEDLRNDGVDDENIVEAAKATAAAKKQSQIPPPPAPILTDSTPIEEIDKEIASRRDLLETTTFGAEGDKALEDSIKQLEEAKTAKVEPEKTPQVSDEITPQDGQTAKSSGSYPEVAGSTPAPATTPEVTGLQAVSENTAPPEQLAERSEIAELNDEENAVVDEDEYEDSDEDEEPEPNAVDTKLEQLQAEHKAKIEADKEERRKLLESRTPEQQQAIVDSFTPGQIITNGVTTGAFVEKTEDGGIVVAQKGKKQKMSPATVQNVTTATAIDPEPTQEKAKIAVLEETNDLGAAGFNPTGEADEDGQILEDKRKDGLGKPFTVSTKLFKKKDGTTVSRSSFTYAPKEVEPKNLKRTRQAEKLNVLRVMNQGVEVRVPNSIPVPAWMTVRPVEGKDYSTVVTAEYEENGVNVGRFNATDPQGSFKEAYEKNQAIRNIKVDASNKNIDARITAGTDATTKTAGRVQDLSKTAQTVYTQISKRWFESVESRLRGIALSGLSKEGQEKFRLEASNKIQNAISKVFKQEKEEASETNLNLVAKTAELFVKGKSDAKIKEEVLGEVQSTEDTKLVNRVLSQLKSPALAPYSKPENHIRPLNQVSSVALRWAKLRPDDTSLDAPLDGGVNNVGAKISEEEAKDLYRVGGTKAETQNDPTADKEEIKKTAPTSVGGFSAQELETMVEADKLAKTAVESGFFEKLEEWKKSLTKLELLALDYLNAPDRTSQYELKRTVEEQLLFLRDRRTFKQLLASVKRRAAELAEGVAGVKIDEAIPRRPAPKSRVAVSAENIAAAQEQARQLSFEDRRSVLISEGLSEDQIDALSDDEVEQQVVQLFALNNAARAQAPKAETKTEPKKTKTLYDQETKTFKAVSATATPVAEAAVEQVALTPDEKFADDYLNEPDAEKQQSMLDAFEKPRIEEAQAKMVERGIDQPTATKIAGNKVKQKTAELISAAYRRKSPQSPGKAKGAAKEIKGAPGRKPSSPKLQRIKRRFLQAKVGLSDEQMVGMSNAEVDRAYLAYNSRADENKAAAAQDAVVSVAPGIERLVELGDQELVGAYADAILAAEKEGDYGKLRDLNFNELVRFGAFESTRELLTRLADPKNKAPRDMQVRAKAFLDMEKRGLKLDNIEVQAANFLKTGTKDRAVWGGLLGRNADYSAFGVYINLDQAHDRETPLQTVLHELAHVATFAKVHGKVKTTAQEDRIIKDLERMRRAAILKAGNASPAMKAAADKAGATTPEARLANYEKALKAMIASGEEGSRRYNGLQNLDEFIVEMTGSPEFVQLLSQLGFGAVNADKRTFNGMIRDAFNAILKLIGVNISPSSELGKAFMDSWNFTFRGTKYKAAPSELLKAVRGVAEETKAAPKTAAKAEKGQSDKSSIPAPQGEAEVKPEGNNQVTKPTAKKAKRAKAGRPTNREMREATALPKTEEEIAAEKAALEKLLEQESKMEGEEAPQSPAAKPRIIRAKTQDQFDQDQADLRASNMEEILFYSGIDEGDYNKLINKGILTPKEIEAGYMQDVPKMLSNIAGDDTVVDGQPIIPAPLRHVAQMLLDLGFDFSKVRFSIADAYATGRYEDWAGLYEPGTQAKSGRISVNLDSPHEGGIAQTIVHEALHHVFFWKTQKGYPLNRVERAAFRDMEKIFKQAERIALGRYTRAGQTLSQAKARLAPGDLFYGLTDMDEFVTEILTNPQFQIFLQQAAPMQGLPKKGGYIRNLLDQIFAYFKDFIYGRDVSGDSLLTQGLDNVLAFIQTPQTEAGVQRAVEQMIGVPAPRATYGGEKAMRPFRHFMRDSLDSAKAMAAAGRTAEEIRTVTGWFPGKYDGKMRWEIPDDGAALTEKWEALEKNKKLRLDEAINHPALFQAYPELGGVVVTKERAFLDVFGSVQGWFNPKTKVLNVTPNAENALSTMLHEMQHWIQDKEGFALGSNTEVAMKSLSQAQKIAVAEKMREKASELIQAQEKVFKTAEDIMTAMMPVVRDDGERAKFNQLAEQRTQAVQALMQAQKLHGTGSPESRAALKVAEGAETELLLMVGLDPKNKLKKWDIVYPIQSAKSWEDVVATATAQLDKSSETILKHRSLLANMLDDDVEFERAVKAFDLSYQLYRNVAGEIESRDVQARQNLTPEQRTATAPYSSEDIALEEAILITEAPMSPAGEAMKMIAKLTGAETKSTFNGGTYTAGGALSPDGKLDKQAGDKWRASRQQITAAARVIDTLSTRLVSAVKAAKKSGVEVSTETMNTALGNLDNPLTQAQRSEVRRMREIDEEEANTLEATHLAKNREAFKVKQRAALAALPANVAEAVSEMNEHIAYYSAMLRDSGILDPSMAATVEANLGIYLHRSYEIFDNEKWAKQVRENTKVMQAAERLIKRNIEQRNAAELIRQTESEGGFISKADAQAQTKGTAKQEQIDKAIDDLLAIGEDGMGSVILRGRIPGQKDLSIFDTRGNISPEIQALWGRYEDPTINYAKSVMKMSSLVANHQFLSDLRGMGLKEGWLYNGPEADRPRGYLKISSDNNKSLAPLAGLHGDKLLVEALYQMFPQNGVSDNYAWVRALSKVTGWSMAAKTVLSPVAQVRNNLGNILFDVAAGNFGFSDISKLKDRMGTAFNMSFRSAFNAYPKEADFRKAMMNEMQELVRRGVIGESIVGNMLGQLMEAKRFSKTEEQFSNHLIGKLQKSAGAVWDTAQKAYSSSDDFWKVMGYMAEVDKYTKAMPGWSPEQVKDHAAKIVRDIRPTYNLSPAVLDKVKAFPFVAPFITFTTEVIRTSINLTKLARYEITEGNRTGNKELQAIGWKRARGIALAALGPSAAATAFMAVAGIGRDDEERLRRFLPDWQKNSQLLLLGNKDGKVSYLDVSYLDPYDYWKKAFGAFMRSLTARDDAEAMERITRGAMEAAGELLRPFKSEQLVSGAVTDILRNQDSAGRQIYNPQDTGFNIASKTTERIWKAFSPGAFDVAGRFIKAGAGDVSDSGRAYNLANELLGLAGQRVTEVNVEQALGFKASKFSRDIRDASSLFTREFNSKGTRSPEEIADAYERANEATYSLTADFRDDVLAAIGLGKISPKKAEEILKANRIGKEDIAMIRSGRYKKYEPSDAAKKIAPKDRIKAAEAAVKRAKDTPL